MLNTKPIIFTSIPCLDRAGDVSRINVEVQGADVKIGYPAYHVNRLSWLIETGNRQNGLIHLDLFGYRMTVKLSDILEIQPDWSRCVSA
jgi:hypothetical protein